jgi:hypothetical protein
LGVGFVLFCGRGKSQKIGFYISFGGERKEGEIVSAEKIQEEINLMLT